MKMIGLRDVTLTATDLNNRSRLIPFAVNQEVEVPAEFVGTAKALGYAKLAEDAEQPAT